MFANNTTTIPAPLIPGFPSSAGDSDNGNQYSLANLFGMFLTITICLLAQPYGSVLYVQPVGPIGRALFFFWRINPLACAAEALLVLYALCEVAWVAITGSSHQDAELVAHSIGERFDAGIAALLLVRRHSRFPPHRALAGANEGTAPRQSSVADGQGSIAPGTSGASPRGSVNGRVIENGNVADLTDQPESFNGAQGRGVGHAEPQIQGTPIIREGEENEPSDDGETTALLGRRQLRSALRSNLLANGELLVDVTTLVATGFVVLKLAATTLPLAVRVAAWCMVAGWIVVQIPVTLSHLRGVEQVDIVLLVKKSVRLDSRLGSLPTRASILTLFLPALLYIGYRVCTWYDPDGPTSLFVVQLALQLGPLYYLQSLTWASISLDCFGCISRRRQRNCSESAPCAGQGPFKPNWKEGVLRMILISGAGVLGAICGYVSSYLWTELVNTCLQDPSKVWACWLLLVFYSLFVILWFGLLVQKSLELSQPLLIITLFWNLATTILVFVGAMLQYRPEDTYRPDWLDWFGRSFKTFDVSELGFY
ncbi:putative Transmembrane protein [Seiridium cardinale]